MKRSPENPSSTFAIFHVFRYSQPKISNNNPQIRQDFAIFYRKVGLYICNLLKVWPTIRGRDRMMISTIVNPIRRIWDRSDKRNYVIALGTLISYTAFGGTKAPNVIFILADDISYADFGCYGAKKIKTPHLDKLARDGVKFTNAYALALTSTPSRYALLTGEYVWRVGASILPGDAPLLIDTLTLYKYLIK